MKFCFDDKELPRICGFDVWYSSNCIYGFQFKYSGDRRGLEFKVEDVPREAVKEEYTLLHDEYIVKVGVKINNLLRKLSFVTNRRRSFEFGTSNLVVKMFEVNDKAEKPLLLGMNFGIINA